MQHNSQYYKLEITRDGMEAYITVIERDEKEEIKKNEGTETSGISKEVADDIIKEVKNIIKVGLLEEDLIRLLADERYGEKTLIAEGIKPIDGKDGYVKFNFDLDKKLIPKILDDGTVNYKELGIVNNVRKGDLLAELIPAEEGTNGYKVTGEPIKYKEGKPPYIKYGKNISLLENERDLVSEVDGLVELKGNKIVVSEVFEVKSVGNETGNIYFNGTVIVRENALNGFQINAEGNVEIKGVVEGAYIENKGDIIVRQGIRGYNRPTIKTEGNVTTKFVENAIINADKDIIAEAIMHSEITSRENISAIGKKGLIVGGVCKAGKEIKAKTIGSSMATTTILEVGVDPYDMQRKKELENYIITIEDNLDKIMKSLVLLDNLKKANRLDSEKDKMYIKLIKTRTALLNNLSDTKNEHERLENSIKNSSRGKIKVSETIYPGVRITIGNSTFFVRDEMARCTFYREEGEIKIGPY